MPCRSSTVAALLSRLQETYMARLLSYLPQLKNAALDHGYSTPVPHPPFGRFRPILRKEISRLLRVTNILGVWNEQYDQVQQPVKQPPEMNNGCGYGFVCTL